MRYFMLLSNLARDERESVQHRCRSKIEGTCRLGEIGIHPSYASDSDEELVRDERSRLEHILRRPVRHSRQHYLKMRMPATFRTLVNLGIGHDHSMGYAEEAGYRASIAVPYPFYDLEFESILPLEIHPFVFMDTTYSMYKKMNAKPLKSRCSNGMRN